MRSLLASSQEGKLTGWGIKNGALEDDQRPTVGTQSTNGQQSIAKHGISLTRIRKPQLKPFLFASGLFIAAQTHVEAITQCFGNLPTEVYPMIAAFLEFLD